MGSSKNILEELLNNSISIKKFLIVYCGVPPHIIIDKKISHSDVKKLIPDIKRIGNDAVKDDKKKIYVGDIVVVKDSYGNLAPYVIPQMNNSINNDDIYIESEIDPYNQEQNVEKELINELINEDLNKLSRYELVELCRFCKKHKKIGEYRIINKYLKLKKEKDVKTYKKEKLKLTMKGRETDD